MMSMAQEIKKIHVNFQGPSCDKSKKSSKKGEKMIYGILNVL